MKTIAPLLLAAACGLPAAAAAADKGSLADADRRFIESAARAGMAEVDAARLAKGKAAAQEVKDFARRMEEDHSSANEELRKLARAKGVALPSDVDRKHHRIMDELRSHTAAQFEHEYMKNQVDDHKDVVRAFEREARGGSDADVKGWASAKLPTLRHHLEMAQAALEGLKSEKAPPRKQPRQETSGSMAR